MSALVRLCLHQLLPLLLAALSHSAQAMVATRSGASAGFSVLVSLSDYTNPHQVLSETAQPCDQGDGNYCDPYFEVQLGMHPYSMGLRNTSKVFANAFNLTGEFYRTEFGMDQEIPDSLYIIVTIRDNDPMEFVQSIVGTRTVDLMNLLPSVPGRTNALKQLVECTPVNRYVRFSLTVEAFCYPGLYGRRCNRGCSGKPVYPAWDERRRGESLEIQGCLTGSGGGQGNEPQETNSSYTEHLSNAMANPVVIAIAAGVTVTALAGIGVCYLVRCSRRTSNDARVRSGQGQETTVQFRQLSQQLSVVSSSGFVAPPVRGSAEVRTGAFKNPVYTGSAGQQQPQQPQQHRQQPDSNNRTTHNDSVDEYEELDDIRQPPLPPRL